MSEVCTLLRLLLVMPATNAVSEECSLNRSAESKNIPANNNEPSSSQQLNDSPHTQGQD